VAIVLSCPSAALACDCAPLDLPGRLASWSLSRVVAVRFLTLNRYRSERPTTYTAEVGRKQILAVKDDRGEEEIIAFSARIIRQARINRMNATSLPL
jgi:hypothetical protein